MLKESFYTLLPNGLTAIFASSELGARFNICFIFVDEGLLRLLLRLICHCLVMSATDFLNMLAIMKG
jgi:hypothetical protein